MIEPQDLADVLSSTRSGCGTCLGDNELIGVIWVIFEESLDLVEELAHYNNLIKFDINQFRRKEKL